ncbi:glycosyltransferase family 4 protein [Singulisphaera acidiphila]|uniref:Glycosyltransferase n=1 Tax=Singulisphaera acidiphila (strain ATCC BAA-1392 / DSM 18658 / VKM B-2454 / MOB10) TaxID=886293 RepID=L0D9P3_SINAD|nr:glycosyltransferase family 4 protein [Singulisphaera acidiphila]AGA26114.1 glycosyltransferase [Singulisphaera acidiphila DSM 18658]
MDDSKLRVCFVVSYFHPLESGAERQALAQGVELVRRGHSVQVVTHAVDGLARDEVVQGIQVHRWVRSSRTGPLFAVSFVAGVIQALRQLRGSYDLIHTHQGLWEAIATGLGRSAFRGVPTLVQPASSGYYGEAEELSRTRGFPLLRRLILRNHAFAAISADIEDQWTRLGVPPERIFRMASGVDATHYRPGSSGFESRLLARPRVLFTGRLHPQKNLTRLLEAWPAVAQRTNANLILVGHGPEQERLEAQAAALGIADRIQFTGAVNDPAEILRAADLFVLPSVAEGMSNSLLEAMATALPCVASGIGGNIDLLGDGVGRLVSGDDPAAWSEALMEILGDPDLASRLGAAARHRVETEFALPIVVDRYLTLYRSLLAARSTNRAGRPER